MSRIWKFDVDRAWRNTFYQETEMTTCRGEKREVSEFLIDLRLRAVG